MILALVIELLTVLEDTLTQIVKHELIVVIEAGFFESLIP